jgi:hypothetical protein
MQIVDILTKYGFSNLIERLNKLDEDIALRVGFLGEFSSGKSSLINAILGKKILPTMDQPTSKRVVEIEGSNVENVQYYKRTDDGSLEGISAIDFSEMSMSHGNNVVYLKVPTNNFLQKGYLLIDTPGIHALDESDQDITFGYLQFLDAAVICQDIQKGTLPQSILDFLVKPEIKPIINNFLFAITKSDLKSEESQKEILNEVIQQLKKLNMEYNLGLNDIEKKVILVSDKESLETLEKSFASTFIMAKDKLLRERKEKETQKIIEEAIKLLKEHRDNLDLNTDEIADKEHLIETDISKIKKEKNLINDRFKKVSRTLEDGIYDELQLFAEKVGNLSEEDELNMAIEDLKDNIENLAIRTIHKNFDDIQFDHLKGAEFVALKNDIKKILDVADIGKTVGTFVLFSVLLPASGAVGGFLEGSVGVWLRRIGMSKNAAQGVLKQFGQIGQYINKINPVDMAVNKLSQYYTESTVKKQLRPLSEKLSATVIDTIEIEIESKIQDVENTLQNKRELLRSLQDDKRQKRQSYINDLNQIAEDIKILNTNNKS